MPRSFAEFGDAIKKVYEGLVSKGTIIPKAEPDIPRVPSTTRGPSGWEWCASRPILFLPYQMIEGKS